MVTLRRVMVVGGRELDITAKDVVRKMRGVQAEPIRDHLVEIVNTEFPPKQVLAVVTGWERQSFTTMEANRVLSRLGFHCCRVGPHADGHHGSRPDNSAQQDLSSIERRVSAAESALAVAQEAIAGLRNRVAVLESRR
jgi:hypothetical protein